jgi:hypothetical protein
LNFGLTRNKRLRRLKLRSNGLTDQPVSQLAFALLDNKGVVECDLAFNTLRDRWFKGRQDPSKLRGPERLRAEAENKITYDGNPFLSLPLPPYHIPLPLSFVITTQILSSPPLSPPSISPLSLSHSLPSLSPSLPLTPATRRPGRWAK